VGLVAQPAVEEVKAIEAVLDPEPLLSAELLELARWLADYYLAGLGEVLEAILPSAVRLKVGVEETVEVRLAVGAQEARAAIDRLPKRANKRARLLEALLRREGRAEEGALLAEAGCGATVVTALRKAGLLVREWVEKEEPLSYPQVRKRPRYRLNQEQARAMAQVEAIRRAGRFGVLLLFGVTGSGKTEVYLQAIARVVAEGGQAIVLVPEISLTPQTIARFRERFDRVAVLHSHLAAGERARYWRSIQRGEAQVVVGARSAIFAPTPHLGLIVIDEEHETTFKQETSPRYHARDVAIVRAHRLGIPVILGSATPTLESYHNSVLGKSRRAVLTHRVAARPLPEVEVVDMGREAVEQKRLVALSRRLELLMQESVARGEQVILFLNRRGFATYIFCPRCGFVLKCPQCDITLTFHRTSKPRGERQVGGTSLWAVRSGSEAPTSASPVGPGLARCHYCGHEAAPPENCPECLFPGIRFTGLGTERIEEVVARRFPTVPLARMDSDTMTRRGAYERVLGAFRRGEIGILVGTQMLAKGLDFPNVTVVGVVNADVSLHVPDLRSAERTFQLLAQVAGRTGRGPKGGRVVVQTFRPYHYAVEAARTHDYLSFATQELNYRRQLNYPPFCRLARVLVEGTSEEAVVTKARELADAIRPRLPKSGAELLGPVPAPIAQLRGQFRWHLLLKAPGADTIHSLLEPVRSEVGHKRVAVTVDVDPIALRLWDIQEKTSEVVSVTVDVDPIALL
jgi:primosomal protein N' (replication factor Y)